jgi:hypothetical protein
VYGQANESQSLDHALFPIAAPDGSGNGRAGLPGLRAGHGGKDHIAGGALWKGFLLARATAYRLEVASSGGMLARKWRARND